MAYREGLAVLPWGGGTQVGLGNLPRKLDLLLGTSGLANLVYHEPADLVASAQAGMTMASLRAELAKGGQTLPLDAPFPDRATIGGIIATNYAGPSRMSFGGPRDWLIGIKVAGSDGRVTKAGGRVVKNVTGYDLNKLYTGSLGTLGVIVEANFKLAPLPEESASIFATFDGPTSAFRAAKALMGLSYSPQALQVVDATLANRLSLATTAPGGVGVLALHSGRRSAVRRKVGDTSKVLTQEGAQKVDLHGAEAANLWQELIDLDWTDDDGPDMALQTALLPSQVEGFYSETSAQEEGFRKAVVVDAGSGLVKLLYWKDGPDSGSTSAMLALIDQVKVKARSYGSNVVVQRCPAAVKEKIDVWGGPIQGLDIMRRIKAHLDPSNILSPGRFVGRI